MARQVWKFPLTTDGWVEMPKGSDLLHVAVQEGVPYLWAEVTPDAPVVRRSVPVYGTGHDIDGAPTYVGTFHLDWMVFHVYATSMEHAVKASDNGGGQRDE